MILALPYPTMTFLPYYVAVDKGFFKAEGLNIDYAHLSDGKAKIMKLFVQGDLEFMYALWEAVEMALHGWEEVRALCGTIANDALMFVRPGINSVEDLKGKTVMIGGRTGASDSVVYYLLKKRGWQAGREVKVVPGDHVERIRAFQNPEVHAVAARFQYWYWAKQAGFRRLSHEIPGLVTDSGGLSTSIRMIRERPEVVKKVMRGMVQAMKYVKENREPCVELAHRLIPYLSREEVEGNYDVMRDHFTLDVNPATIDFMAEVLSTVLGREKRVTAKKFLDPSFLHQARAELGIG